MRGSLGSARRKCAAVPVVTLSAKPEVVTWSVTVDATQRPGGEQRFEAFRKGREMKQVRRGRTTLRGQPHYLVPMLIPLRQTRMQHIA
jgi:hypothetical protein